MAKLLFIRGPWTGDLLFIHEHKHLSDRQVYHCAINLSENIDPNDIPSTLLETQLAEIFQKRISLASYLLHNADETESNKSVYFC